MEPTEPAKQSPLMEPIKLTEPAKRSPLMELLISMTQQDLNDLNSKIMKDQTSKKEDN